MKTTSTYYVSTIIFLFLIGFSYPIYSQQYISSSHHFSVEEGLSGRYVLDVVEDEQGFIWISTWMGIDRFDGFKFKNYPKAEYGFRADSYPSILMDRNGMLWFTNNLNNFINSNNVTDIFDPKKEKLVKSLTFPFKELEIKSVDADKQKNIWIATKNGNIFKYDGQQFELILEHQTFDKFLVTSSKTIATLDTMGKSLHFFDHENHLIKKFTYQGDFNSIYIDQNESLILQTTDASKFRFERYHPTQSPEKVFFYDKDNKPIQFKYSNISTNIFLQWRNEEIILCEGRKVFSFDKNFKFLYEFEFVDIPPLQGTSTGFHIDGKNRIWLPSSNGVFVFTSKKKLFNNLLVSEKLSDSRCIAEDNAGNLYINQGETYRIDAITKDAEVILPRSNRGAFIVNNRNLFIGNYSGSVFEYDLITNKLEHTYPNENKLGTSNIFYQSKKTGRLYLGTNKKGVVIIDTNKKELIRLTKSKIDLDLDKLTINCFHENDRGIWVGTNIGLILFDEEEGYIEHHPVKIKDSSSANVFSIYEDENEEFWIGTFKEGLFRWKSSNNTFTRMTVENGLSDNTLYAILADDFGYLWISSNLGLMRMNKKNLTIQTYLPIDGIPHQEFNSTSSFKGKDGTLYFGGLKGVTSINPKEFQIQTNNNITSAPIISGLQVFQSSKGAWINQQLDAKNELKLPTDASAIKIQFLAKDILNKDKNQFVYWEGNKKDSIFLKNNTLELSDLSYGWKEIFIQGKASDEEWSEEVLSFNIHRRYPVYVRTTFILGLICSLGLLFFFYKKRKSKNERKTELLIEKKIKEVKAELKEQNQPAPKEEEPVLNKAESESEIETKKPNSARDEWMKILNEKAIQLIDKGKFSIPDLAQEMNLSERQFRRKLKQNTNMLPTAFMREIRLKKAEFLLQNQIYQTVSEVCFAVGFSTPKHFSKLFQERFGKKPSSYLENKKQGNG